MPRAGPRRVNRYDLQFKPNAVGLSKQPGVQVQDVAAGSHQRCQDPADVLREEREWYG